MRHVQTARATWAITGVFAAAALLFAATRPDVANVQEVGVQERTTLTGQVLFEAQCAQCHGAGAIAEWAARHPDPEERVSWLDDLLQRHFPPAEDERPLIIEYIEHAIEGDLMQ